MSVMSFFIPGKDGPEASVTVNLPAGFYTVGNSGSSLKAGFATGALAGPMLVGYGALMPMMFMSSVAPEEKWAEADEAVEVEADAIEFGPEVEFNNQIPPQFVPRDEIKKENLRKENKEIDRIRRQLELQERGVKRTSPRGD